MVFYEEMKVSGPRRKDEAGKIYGSWKVLRFATSKRLNGKQGAAQWECLCLKCGSKANVYGYRLRRKESEECISCRHNIHQTIWGIIVQGAKRRHLAVKVTKEEAIGILEKQKNRCALSGLPINIAPNSKAFREGKQFASLDRIDSSKGYTPENIQWVDKRINRMKMDMPESEFLKLCKTITQNTQSLLSIAA